MKLSNALYLSMKAAQISEVLCAVADYVMLHSRCAVISSHSYGRTPEPLSSAAAGRLLTSAPSATLRAVMGDQRLSMGMTRVP